MIITKDFAILLYPKTGTTFTRRALQGVHRSLQAGQPKKALIERLRLSKPDLQILKTGSRKRKNVHGGVRDIPKRYQNRSIISIARNPFSLLLSIYSYGSWHRKEGRLKDKAGAQFPNYPSLSFPEFIEYQTILNQYRHENRPTALKQIKEMNIGPLTTNFINFYFYQPDQVLRRLNENFIKNGEYLQYMPKIQFLRQEYLRDDLHQLLAQEGYSEKSITLIHTLKSKNVSQKNLRANEELIDSNCTSRIKEAERHLFDILDDQGIAYNRNGIGFSDNKT